MIEQNGGIPLSLHPPRDLRTVLEATLRKLEHRIDADPNPDLVRLRLTLLKRITALDGAMTAANR